MTQFNDVRSAARKRYSTILDQREHRKLSFFSCVRLCDECVVIVVVVYLLFLSY